MISYIKGTVVKKGLDYIVIDNNDMGYFVNTSLSSLNKLCEGEKATILTYMHIREDVLALYGFLTSDEIELFKKLISVNGIGPKAGLSVLSTYETNTVKEIILKEDVTRMSKVPGIGKKTASKVILELRDKVGAIDGIVSDTEGTGIFQAECESSDILSALVGLGFNSYEAKKVLDKIDVEGKSENEIIKEALKNINRQV
ncbi:Holliday junction branch migration protein RuvA [Sedimentibacter hydroxybenzoicus DSM 7310]|uniref:Holliday junction branch migration complex subunit RuvA n=1 Tax=Sedimentibacter hydroxybenzoicus DSM 7310 TaxID=1123245 RepID=A0A974BMM3_SEDHY|nr:Holliday junction branch migration protein RuvA [Sedimentibacter hydroxybenzoicus]NYB75631.1 Holliday junction branch migration protein RuvA [Sedimentibacter hydroxybenzoicus DSM 7310]